MQTITAIKHGVESMYGTVPKQKNFTCYLVGLISRLANYSLLFSKYFADFVNPVKYLQNVQQKN